MANVHTYYQTLPDMANVHTKRKTLKINIIWNHQQTKHYRQNVHTNKEMFTPTLQKHLDNSPWYVPTVCTVVEALPA